MDQKIARDFLSRNPEFLLKERERLDRIQLQLNQEKLGQAEWKRLSKEQEELRARIFRGLDNAIRGVKTGKPALKLLKGKKAARRGRR